MQFWYYFIIPSHDDGIWTVFPGSGFAYQPRDRQSGPGSVLGGKRWRTFPPFVTGVRQKDSGCEYVASIPTLDVCISVTWEAHGEKGTWKRRSQYARIEQFLFSSRFFFSDDRYDGRGDRGRRRWPRFSSRRPSARRILTVASNCCNKNSLRPIN